MAKFSVTITKWELVQMEGKAFIKAKSLAEAKRLVGYADNGLDLLNSVEDWEEVGDTETRDYSIDAETLTEEA